MDSYLTASAVVLIATAADNSLLNEFGSCFLYVDRHNCHWPDPVIASTGPTSSLYFYSLQSFVSCFNLWNH